MTMHTRSPQSPQPVRRTRQGGFTLIEMMISITIGLAILAGLVGVLATNSSNSKTNDRTSELMTNGRYALNSIKQELREAGFRGYTWAEPSTPSPWTALVNGTGCYGAEAGASANGFATNIRQGVWGSNNANPFAATCIPASRITRHRLPFPQPKSSTRVGCNACKRASTGGTNTACMCEGCAES